MRYQDTTGLNDEQIAYLLEILQSRISWDSRRKLTLKEAVVATLQALRANATHAILAFYFQVNQSTISRTIRLVVSVLEKELDGYAIDPHDLGGTTRLIDGTMIPTGNRSEQPKLYSGKRHAAGMNIQVVTDLSGQLLAASEPVVGSTHDLTAFRQSPFFTYLNTPDTIADLGYLGSNMTIPFKTSKYINLHDDEKEINQKISQWRARVEHAIRHLKQWKILATGYRGRLTELPKIIHLVIALERLRITW